MSEFSVKNYNFRLVALVIALNVIGILVINSATGGDRALVTRQIVGICAGIVVAGVLSFIPYRGILKFYAIIYIGCITFLVLVLVLGLIRGGARRWITLPVIGQLQPSEFVKIGLIAFFAQFLGKNEERINSASVIVQFIGLAALPLILILLEPDLSTTIVTAVIIISMIYVAGISYKIIGFFAAIVIPIGTAFMYLIRNGKLSILNEYQTNRILAFFDTTGAYSDANLQQNSSIMAIASGQLFGKGLNNTSLDSVKNGNFLAAEQTDFIFAVIGEELGFVGCLAVIVLFALIVFECYRMAAKTEDIRGKIICTGVGTLIAFQSFTNIAVAIGVFPNTGLPLPFISYGLSSLMSLYLGLGLVLNVGLTGNTPVVRRYR